MHRVTWQRKQNYVSAETMLIHTYIGTSISLAIFQFLLVKTLREIWYYMPCALWQAKKDYKILLEFCWKVYINGRSWSSIPRYLKVKLSHPSVIFRFRLKPVLIFIASDNSSSFWHSIFQHRCFSSEDQERNKK